MAGEHQYNDTAKSHSKKTCAGNRYAAITLRGQQGEKAASGPPPLCSVQDECREQKVWGCVANALCLGARQAGGGQLDSDQVQTYRGYLLHLTRAWDVLSHDAVILIRHKTGCARPVCARSCRQAFYLPAIRRYNVHDRTSCAVTAAQWVLHLCTCRHDAKQGYGDLPGFWEMGVRVSLAFGLEPRVIAGYL